ncbi:MAG TPA: hypothetical protein VIV55_10005 [Flavobacterium sp.]
MAAITGAVIAAGTAAYSISQSVKAAKEKKKAQDAIDRQHAPELQNAGEDLRVSTLGSDIERQDQAQLAANQVQAAQEAGTRGVVGSVGKIAAGNQAVGQRISANLDQQQKEIDYYKAQDEVNLRGIRETRYKDKLAALSSQYNAANQNQQQFMGNGLQALGSGASNYASTKLAMEEYKDLKDNGGGDKGGSSKGGSGKK